MPNPAAQPTLIPPPPPAPPATPEPRPLMETLRQSAVFGSGLVGGGAVVWSVVELLRAEPDKGFKLLESFGPWVFIVALIVWVLNGWVTKSIVAREKADERMGVVLDRIVATQERLAGAAEAQAAAQQQAADKDDRQMQEIQTLTAYTSQESERNSIALREISEAQVINGKAIQENQSYAENSGGSDLAS